MKRTEVGSLDCEECDVVFSVEFGLVTEEDKHALQFVVVLFPPYSFVSDTVPLFES